MRLGYRAYLKSRPPALRADGRNPVPASSGSVFRPFERGSVFLEPTRKTDGAPVRLVWSGPDDRASHPAPEGGYRVTNFVVERGHQGSTWLLWCSGRKGPQVRIDPGRETKLELDPAFRVEADVLRTQGSIRISAKLKSAGGMDVMLIDAGRTAADRRIPPSFRLLDSEGRDIGGGTMAYG